MGKKVFVFDSAKCNGCHCCQLACKDENCEQAWPPYSAPQPETGQFWMKVEEKERGSVPKVKISYWVHGCSHCDNAPCMEVAPEIVYKRADGLVIIDPEKSKGRREIVDSCPYGAIYWNDELEIPQKCTGCAHLLDDGWEVPRCVEACCTGALRFGDIEEFADEIKDAEAYLGITYPEPNFFYLNMPKRFVAGEIYDEVADEVLIGAPVSLCLGDEVVATTTTDEFGDFWFNQVDPANYTVSVAVDGYMPRVIPADATEADQNVGPIALYEAA